MLISDESVREQIAHCLALIDGLLPDLADHTMSLEKLDKFCQALIADNRDSATSNIRKEMGGELSIAYLGTLLIGLTSIVVEHDKPRLLSKSLIHPTGIPDPNFVFAKMLVKLANYVLAVIYLVEAGLESQARTTLRVFLELSWLTILVVADPEKMTVYAQETDEETEKKLYYKHFTASKLLRGLADIESQLGFPKDVQQALSNIRSELYSMYSKTVHHSYAELMIGSMSYSFEKEPMLRSTLFGRASKASFPTLYHLNDAFFLLFAMLFKVFRQVHGLMPPYSGGWQDIYALHGCFEFTAENRVIPEWHT